VPSDTKLIVNLTRGTALCRGEIVDRLVPRVRGLAGRDDLPAGCGLLLRPAPPVHTAFNRFDIDALLLDAELTVLDIRAGVRPWRIAHRRSARAVLELAAGESHRLGVRVGDRLGVREGKPVASLADPPAQDLPPRSAPRDAEGPIPIRPPRAERAREEWTAYEAVVAAPPEPGPVAALVAPVRVEPATRDGGDSAPESPTSVLVISPDRRFRSVTTVLIARRGCSVATTAHADCLAELAQRAHADVVVLDLTVGPAASSGALEQARKLALPVGVVLVDEEEAADGPGGPARVHGKWGPFPVLFAAIEAAGRERGSERVDHEPI